MTLFLQYLVSGLATGSIYALVALGLALIYRSTRILNFAHGDIATAGTFFAFTLLGLNLHYGPAFILALVFGAALAMAFYFCVLVPAQRREATHLGQIILTLGLGLIIQGLIARFGGAEPQASAWKKDGGDPVQRFRAFFPSGNGTGLSPAHQDGKRFSHPLFEP